MDMLNVLKNYVVKQLPHAGTIVSLTNIPSMVKLVWCSIIINYLQAAFIQ